jgi:hypothetical protein
LTTPARHQNARQTSASVTACDEPLLSTAYHEAGHAIAVQLRGGAVTQITIEPGLTVFTLPREPQKLYRNGVRVADPQPYEPTQDDAFVAYAGPWAQERCHWRMPTLDVPDEHGNSFAQYVVARLEKNTTDHADYLAAPKPPDADELWSAELEQHWPRIQQVAQRMFAKQMDFRRRQINRQRSMTRQRINRYRRTYQR